MSFVGFLAGLLWPVGSLADGEHVFWEVTGKHNTVYLLGSVHMLQSKDRALPAVAEAAYLDAEHIVEELDILAATGDMSGAAVLALQILPEGKTLPAVLGADLYVRLKKDAAALYIDTDFMTRMQPWFVALTVMNARLLKAGFNPLDGFDYQIALRAEADSKPLRGLETVADQLSLFANLPLEEQCEFLRATLDETDVSAEVAKITAAWLHGDIQQLEVLLRSGAEESPEFFQALTTDRNLRWLPQLETMLADPKDDYLVVTGALHMVGKNGVVELLRRRGYKVVRK